jgi:hypothetical protein
MRCQSCNKNLSDRESSRKFINWREIENSEDRYIGLCSRCLHESGILYVENPFVSDDDFQDETEYIEGEDDA